MLSYNINYTLQLLVASRLRRLYMNTRKFITLPTWLGMFVLLGMLSQEIYAEQKKMKILVSIEPIALIVRDLVGEQADVQVLVTGAASPHHYSLAPSQLQQFNAADLIIWIDPNFEFFMAKIMTQLSSDKAVVMQLSTLDDIVWTQKHNDGSKFHEDKIHKNQGHEHDGEHDFHLWLNPANIKIIAKNIQNVLNTEPPESLQKIKIDADAYAASLDALTLELTTIFDDVKNKKYAAFHNAYGHFIEAFNLTQIDFIAQVPDEQISGKRLLNLKSSFRNATCLIADILEIEEAHKMSRLLKLPVVQVDVLAVEKNSPSFGYHDYLRNMAVNFSTCLHME